jgi:hypothetical protein
MDVPIILRSFDMRFAHPAIAAVTLAFAIGLGAPALADETKFMAMLTGTDEVPPTDSPGTGTGNITWNSDTKTLSWSIEFSGLTGPAVAAHFHGPADPGANAGVAVPITDLESPSEGSATLTDAQAAELAAGKWYVNFHTEKFPDGEIRGQVVKGSM